MSSEGLFVGSRASMLLHLLPFRRSHPEAMDEADGGWIDAEVSVAAGAFRGEYVACLRAEEFVRFRQDLERLYRELRGSGSFHSTEGWVTVEVTGDGQGHFAGRCRASDAAGDGNVLEGELAFDQTDLPAMIEALRAIERAFPSQTGR